MHVRWRVEAQTLLPLVQAGACLGVRWLVMEVHDGEVHLEEGDHGDLVGGGRGQVGEVCKVQEVAGGHRVLEGGTGHGVHGQGEVLGPWGPVSP